VPKYIKIAEVEGNQFLPEMDIIPEGVISSGLGRPSPNNDFEWQVKTLEGALSISSGDYVMTGVDGEHWPVFERTYKLCGK
jgi:hypothetical protein